jgi:hypothetical protein
MLFFSQINQIIGFMKHSIHQHILQICAQLDASSLPISVGLVKARATSSLPLPAVIKSINAYKGGERAPEMIQTNESNDVKNQTKTPATPKDLTSLIQMVLSQQESITELQEQVTQLKAALKAN